jgi:hypothetical protein
LNLPFLGNRIEALAEIAGPVASAEALREGFQFWPIFLAITGKRQRLKFRKSILRAHLRT